MHLLALIFVMPFALALYGALLAVILLLGLTIFVLNRTHNYDSAARVTTVLRALIRVFNPLNWAPQPRNRR